MNHDEKLLEMGRAATALLQLHLKYPTVFYSEKIVSKLFDKFEELELEEDIDG